VILLEGKRASKTDWKFEAWKAAVSLTVKVLLVFLGALVIPVILQKGSFSVLAVIIGSVLSGASPSLWLVLVLRVNKKTGGLKDER
jgi:hypothetical protein